LTAWKSIQRRKIPTIAQTHYMGPRNRTPPERARHSAITPPSTESKGARRNAKVRRRTSLTRNYMRIVKPICCKLPLYKEERWKITSHPRLPTHQQMDEEK
jgi:hypothetical protein